MDDKVVYVDVEITTNWSGDIEVPHDATEEQIKDEATRIAEECGYCTSQVKIEEGE